MRKLYENFYIFHCHKRIVSAQTILRNMVYKSALKDLVHIILENSFFIHSCDGFLYSVKGMAYMMIGDAASPFNSHQSHVLSFFLKHDLRFGIRQSSI